MKHDIFTIASSTKSEALALRAAFENQFFLSYLGDGNTGPSKGRFALTVTNSYCSCLCFVLFAREFLLVRRSEKSRRVGETHRGDWTSLQLAPYPLPMALSLGQGSGMGVFFNGVSFGNYRKILLAGVPQHDIVMLKL